jgi:Caspase domain/Domain of unknown function (DUF4850)
MGGRRVALLVATDHYQDSGLSRLAAPSADVRQLAAVLDEPAIAGFEVVQLRNRPNAEVGKAIGSFYRDRRRDDLTLLYFSGHGIKDDYGHLYLAMTDTDRDNLHFTGLRGEQIRLAMEGCRSRQNVLILDCCYAGAFPAGPGVKGDTAVHALEQLTGRGSVVLTSSDATQYSFEGSQLIETGPASFAPEPSSLFTRFLVEGLRTGRADLDGDGNITLDELYKYVHDHVTEERPQQRPKKKEDVEGRILIAQNIHWTLPLHISNALSSPYSVAKLAALGELRSRYNVGNTIVQQRVLETMRELAEDDSKQVSDAANQFLSAVAEEKARQAAEERAQQEAPYCATEIHSQVDQDAISILQPGRGQTEDGLKTPGVRGDDRAISRRLMVTVSVATVAVIGLITAFILIPGSSPSKLKATPDTSPPSANGQTVPSTATPSTKAGTVTASLQVVICPTSLGAGNRPAVSLPRSRPLVVLQALAAELSVYVDNQGIMELVGPKGWSCTAAYGADGSGGVGVYPHGEGPSSAVAIVGSESSACVGCTLLEACPLFPSAATALHSDLGQPCPTRPPAAETRVAIAAGIVAFEDPPRVKGDGRPSGGQYPANGVMTYHPSAPDGSWQVTCTLPSSEKDFCTEVLNTFVSWYGQR